MKKTVVLMTLLTLLPGLFPIPAYGASPQEDAWKSVREAYIYAFPLVLMDATKTASTNAEVPIPDKGKAPINQLIHGKKLADADFKIIVSPNVDTVYSQAWYDLSDEPMVYVLPETNRFCNVQILDAWTNTVSVFDKAGAYAIALSAWEGELPEGVTRINVPTAMAWSITRTVLSGEADLPNVGAIQKEMKLLPLSAYVAGGEYTPAKGSYAAENNYVPVEKILSMGPRVFFDKANELMKANPPAPADQEVIERLAGINVGPGMIFDPGILPGDIQAQWVEMIRSLQADFIAEASKFSVKLGQWEYFGAPIGEFGTEYTYRATVALAGLGANTVDVALYLRTEADEAGEPLTSDKTYVMHFESFPPLLEDGFWSVTAYNSDHFLIDNPIDRYCINDRSNFVLNEDGSLDIILSEKQPENAANWLPVSGNAFHFFMRI